MEKKLQDTLLEGEQIRWSGRPAPFRLRQCPDHRSCVLTWFLSLAAFLLIMSYFVPYYLQTQRSTVDLVILTVVVAFLPVMLSMRPLLDKYCLEQTTIYAITNFRVIAIVQDELMYIPLNHQLKVAIEKQDQDRGHLCFDAAVGKDIRKSRTNAVLGIRRDGTQNNMLGMMFYNVNEPEQLLDYFA